jgi:DNA-binding SARP family transcriptional activator/tetratricopeptide (TPR) repeat protein
VIVSTGGGPELGRLVRGQRQAAGLTQVQLAAAAGVSVALVRDLEQGRTGRPRQQSVQRISAALGIRLPEAHDATGAAPVTAGPGGRLQLQVLGPLTAWRDGRRLELGPARQRAVLGLLAAQPNALVRRTTICEALWGDSPPATAVSMIQAYVSRLRRLLDTQRPAGAGDGSGILVAAGSGYRLNVTGDQLDVIAFGELCAQARNAARDGRNQTACELYEQAMALWQGEPLADIDALHGHPAVLGLARRWAAAVEEYADAASPQGWHRRVLGLLQALTVREPLSERAHARLMIALAGSGQQAAALEVFEAVRGRLDSELGVWPGAELAAAHARVLNQDVPAEAAQTQANDAVAGAGDSGRRAGRAVPRQLPPAGPHFVGRAAELKALSGLLDRGSLDAAHVVATAVIGGTAGVGKTTLAVHWAHQVADRFPDGQLYVNLRGFGPAATPVSPAEVLRGFLDALGVPGRQMPASLDSLAALYRSTLYGRKVLVVLDNARDPAHVRPLLPGEAGCAVVITSRNQLTGLVAADGAHPLMLDVLTDSESRELLERRLGPERLAGEEAAAARLTWLCARLPLALAITAARAAALPDARLAALASELNAVAASPGELDLLDTGEAATSIRAAFSWSYQSMGGDASRMFRLLALHPGPDIAAPAAASLAGVSAQQAGDLLRSLTRASLLTEHVPGRFAFHDLLRAYAAELARTGSGADRHAQHRMLDHYLHTAHAAAALSQLNRHPLVLRPPRPGSSPEQLGDDQSALAWFKAEHQNLRAAIAQAAAGGFDSHAWQLTCTLAAFVLRSGNWHQHEWGTILATALAAAQRQGDLAGQARVHWELGTVFTRLGRYDDTLSHLSRALDMYRQLGDAAGEARAHLGLAHMFDCQGAAAEALRHAERALDLHRAAGPAGSQDLALALNATGFTAGKAGDYQRALSYCHQALDLHRELGSRPGEAATLDSLGSIHDQIGRHAEAIAFYQQSLSMLRRLANLDAEASVLTRIGDSYRAAGNPAKAREAWQRALTILDDIQDPGAEELRARLHRAGR